MMLLHSINISWICTYPVFSSVTNVFHSLIFYQRKGIVTQRCSDNEGHIRALSVMDEDENERNLFSYISMKIVYLNEEIT